MSSSYYFASRGHGSNTTEFEAIPAGGAQLKDFFSRPVNGHSYNSDNNNGDGDDDDGSYAVVEQKVAPQMPGSDPPVGSLLLRRKVPMKVEPKGMFAVERTFMQWMVR